MRTRTIEVTPNKAAEYLKTMGRNRSESFTHVSFLAKEMKAGLWCDNGETIKFDENRKLLDGQHRLLAIIKCGRPVQMTIQEGVSKKVFHTLDTGKKRTLSDVLSIAGFKNSHILGTVAKLCYWYENRETLPFCGGGGGVPHITLLRFSQRDKKLVNAAAIAGGRMKRMNSLMPRALPGLLFYNVCEKYLPDLDSFMNQLISGENLQKGNPAYVLRERLLKNRANKHASLSRLVILALLVKSWNSYLLGEEINHLRWTPFGAGADNFPEIVVSPE